MKRLSLLGSFKTFSKFQFVSFFVSIFFQVYEKILLILDRKDEFSKVVCDECLDIVVQTFNHREKFTKNSVELVNEGVKVKSPNEVNSPQTKFSGIKRESCDNDSEMDTKRRKTETGAQSGSGRNPFTCLTCEQTFKKNCQLRAHQHVQHGNDFKFLFQCTECQNSFMNEKTLHKHLKIHEIDSSADKVFEDGDLERERICANCSQKFQTLDRLRKHWSFHHERVTKKKK